MELIASQLSFPRNLSSCSSSSKITSASSMSIEVSSNSAALLFLVLGSLDRVEFKLRLLFAPATCSSATFHPLIWLNLVSPTVISKGNSGIQTVNLARPVYVPYFTRTEALLEPRISVPSTYTLLQEDDTCKNDTMVAS